MGTIIVAVVAGLLVGIAFRLGYRMGLARGSKWLVRPHTKRSLKHYPLPEQGNPTVAQAAFVRTNLPNSTSKME